MFSIREEASKKEKMAFFIIAARQLYARLMGQTIAKQRKRKMSFPSWISAAQPVSVKTVS